MIIKASAPCRISLAGGGTDVPLYYAHDGGFVVNTAINLRQHIVLYTDKDAQGKENHIPEGCSMNLCQRILDKYAIKGRVLTACDGKIGAGLGTSGAFCVAMLAAVHRAVGKRDTLDRLAEEAYAIESEIKVGGKQDQYAAAYGGLSAFTFTKNVVHVSRFPRECDVLMDSLVLIYVNKRQEDIQKHFSVVDEDKRKALDSIKDYAYAMVPHVRKGTTESIAVYMELAWQEKKQVSPNITTELIDKIYTHAINNGALTGRLLGSGGGGYMLFVVPPEKKQAFILHMDKNGYQYTDCSISWQGVEARIV